MRSNKNKSSTSSSEKAARNFFPPRNGTRNGRGGQKKPNLLRQTVLIPSDLYLPGCWKEEQMTITTDVLQLPSLSSVTTKTTTGATKDDRYNDYNDATSSSGASACASVSSSKHHYYRRLWRTRPYFFLPPEDPLFASNAHNFSSASKATPATPSTTTATIETTETVASSSSHQHQPSNSIDHLKTRNGSNGTTTTTTTIIMDSFFNYFTNNNNNNNREDADAGADARTIRPSSPPPPPPPSTPPPPLWDMSRIIVPEADDEDGDVEVAQAPSASSSSSSNNFTGGVGVGQQRRYISHWTSAGAAAPQEPEHDDHDQQHLVTCSTVKQTPPQQPRTLLRYQRSTSLTLDDGSNYYESATEEDDFEDTNSWSADWGGAFLPTTAASSMYLQGSDDGDGDEQQQGQGDNPFVDSPTHRQTKKHKSKRRTKNKNQKKRRMAKKTRWCMCAVVTFVNLALFIGIILMAVNLKKNKSSASSSQNGGLDVSSAKDPEDALGPMKDRPTSEPVFTEPAPTMSPTTASVVMTQQPEPVEIPTQPTPTFNPTSMNPTMFPTPSPTQNPTTMPTPSPTNAPTDPPVQPAPTPASNAVVVPAPTDARIPEVEQRLPEGQPLQSGPLVGHVTSNEVTLWAYNGPSQYSMEIVVYENNVPVSIDVVTPRSDRNNAVIATLGGLRPNTFYEYGMHIGGQRVGSGGFKTAPVERSTAGTKFNYMLTSCMNIRQFKDQRVWDVVLSQTRPEFAFLAGDTVYIDERADLDASGAMIPGQLWNRNMEQRNEPHFKNFLRQVPTYSNWNDHEYGKNDSDMNQPGKENSLQIFKSVWANPSYGTPNMKGVFYSFYRGDVHYIVPDDRWYRNPSTGQAFGPSQLEWIKQQLLSSTGVFKILVCGSDATERNWAEDVHAMGDFIRDNRIMGVMFHAGDIHRNEFKNLPLSNWPYEFKQITSSGIAKVWRRPFVNIKVDTTVPDPTVTAHFYGANSTAVDATWSNDPNLSCSSIVKASPASNEQRYAEHSCTEVIRLSDLSF